MHLVALCVWFEEIIHVCFHGVDDPRLLFELCAFIVEPLPLIEKTLLFRLQRLQARQLFIALHSKKCTPCRLEDHKFCLMFCLEPRLVFCLLEGVIYRLELLVVGDVFDKRLDFPQTCFNAFQFLAGTVIWRRRFILCWQ